MGLWGASYNNIAKREVGRRRRGMVTNEKGKEVYHYSTET